MKLIKVTFEIPDKTDFISFDLHYMDDDNKMQLLQYAVPGNMLKRMAKKKQGLRLVRPKEDKK